MRFSDSELGQQAFYNFWVLFLWLLASYTVLVLTDIRIRFKTIGK